MSQKSASAAQGDPAFFLNTADIVIFFFWRKHKFRNGVAVRVDINNSLRITCQPDRFRAVFLRKFGDHGNGAFAETPEGRAVERFGHGHDRFRIFGQRRMQTVFFDVNTEIQFTHCRFPFHHCLSISHEKQKVNLEKRSVRSKDLRDREV